MYINLHIIGRRHFMNIHMRTYAGIIIQSAERLYGRGKLYVVGIRCPTNVAFMGGR